MRQLNLVIVFSLILSITTPIHAANHSQERLSIPELSLAEIFKEILDLLKIDIRNLHKAASSEESSNASENTANSEETNAGDETDTEEEGDPGFGPYSEPNGG